MDINGKNLRTRIEDTGSHLTVTPLESYLFGVRGLVIPLVVMAAVYFVGAPASVAIIFAVTITGAAIGFFMSESECVIVANEISDRLDIEYDRED